MTQLLAGFILAVIISYLAYRLHSLNRGGAVAAVITGTIIFGIGGWKWATLLLIFFVSSSLLSRVFGSRKKDLAEKFSKGHERDAGQVFGNGGLAAAFASMHFFFPHDLWPWLGFAASLAAVNADTWATELGVLNPNPPRLATNLWKQVEKGTSGGISLMGTLAALAGAAVIGVPAGSFLTDNGTGQTGLIITLAGLLGSLFDSLLGATFQAMYYCPTCKKETERHPIHTCGTPTTQTRGWSWLNNDWVNFACGAFGVFCSFILFPLIRG